MPRIRAVVPSLGANVTLAQGEVTMLAVNAAAKVRSNAVTGGPPTKVSSTSPPESARLCFAWRRAFRSAAIGVGGFVDGFDDPAGAADRTAPSAGEG